MTLYRRGQFAALPLERQGIRPVRVKTLMDRENLYPRPSDIFQKVAFCAFEEQLQKHGAPWIAGQGAEHLTDIAGLSAMALSSADKLRSLSRHPEDPDASRVGGEAGRNALDLGGLAAMAAPSAMAVRELRKGNRSPHLAGGGSRMVNALNLAGLAALAVPTADNIQAHLRGGEDKQLLGHKAHAALELGGLGALAGGVGRQLRTGQTDPRTAKTLMGGYGLLAAPAAHTLVSDEHEGPPSRLVPASQLAGLAMLGAPSLAHLGGH